MTASSTNVGGPPVLPKWRGWTVTGTSLGVVAAVTLEEAEKKLIVLFGSKLDIITEAYRGAEAVA